MALRVLVADDSPMLRQSIGELLQSADVLSVVTAGDGMEAVRLAREITPDVVILDYRMPGLNGVQAAQLIRETSPEIPLIMLTATAAEHLIAMAFAAGIRGYVLKMDAGDDLIRAMYAVRQGATYVSPGASRVLYERYLPAPKVS